jgi:ABC-type Na+ transport system ATPase subunit NatA
MSASAIQFQDVQKSFELAFSLGPLSLTVPDGSIYALIGPNGAGKSTALNMLMGMGEPTSGSIQVLGRDIRSEEVEIKRRTAYVSPDMDYRAWGTIGRAIDFVRGFYPDWNAARCEELQFMFGVHRDSRVDALSFGARMKLALVLALSRDAELLVLDEPTLGLDAIARRQLQALPLPQLQQARAQARYLGRWFPLLQRILLPVYMGVMAATYSVTFAALWWFRWGLVAAGVALCVSGYFILVYQLRAGIRPSSNNRLFSAG